MTPHDVPYFVDNGAYTGAFDMADWLDALEQATTAMPRWPDFIVWPDVYGDAAATRDRCRRLFDRDAPLLPRRGDLDRYVAFQPGLTLADQHAFATEINAAGIFLGGPRRWKRAHGPAIVEQAQADGRRVHLGNPGGADGLVWAYRAGFDSLDTTTIFQNGYWHYLDALEAATDETRAPGTDTAQAALGGWAD